MARRVGRGCGTPQSWRIYKEDESMASVHYVTPSEDLLSAMLGRCVKVDQAHEGVLASALNEMLATLHPREARVLRLRFGLGDHAPQTLQEVGEAFDTSYESIRRIEVKALEKLRHPVRIQLLLGLDLPPVTPMPKEPKGKRRRKPEPLL
jgi:DNA-directed RNA polymerase specialized sigma24 family protein